MPRAIQAVIPAQAGIQWRHRPVMTRRHQASIGT